MSNRKSISYDKGENSNDECCMCGDEWNEGKKGWVLCDTPNCENTVCERCTTLLSLSVSELFYCPLCAGSGNFAAATAGATVVSAVAACSELATLPLSFKATRKILTNLVRSPEESKYRKLRIGENKKVKELLDYEPVLNILSSVGFVRKSCPREKINKDGNETNLCTEEVLVLEGEVPTSQIGELLSILESLAPETRISSETSKGKRKANDEADTDAKKQREQL